MKKEETMEMKVEKLEARVLQLETFVEELQKVILVNSIGGLNFSNIESEISHAHTEGRCILCTKSYKVGDSITYVNKLLYSKFIETGQVHTMEIAVHSDCLQKGHEAKNPRLCIWE